MKTAFILIATACTAFAAVDKDLQTKPSAQVREIASALRHEVADGRENLRKANVQISDLDAYGRKQWQRAEDEKADKKRWKSRAFAFTAFGALGGAIASAIFIKSSSRPAPAEPPVRRVRAPKPNLRPEQPFKRRKTNANAKKKTKR